MPTSMLTKLAGGLGTALQMQGTAIAFLLVFRTDNAYRRLAEVRECWNDDPKVTLSPDPDP